MTRVLLSTLQGNITKRIPFWFMRQAGRYLPEYREIRQNYKNFLEFCYTPEAAVEVTMQPIRRFDMDAAIMFSDILVLPHAMGADVWFEEGEGPRIAPIITLKNLEKLSTNKNEIENFLAPIFTILKTLRDVLSEEKTLIGFAGSPWTIACYMVQGRGQGKDGNLAYLGFASVREKAKQDPEFFAALIERITQATIVYLSKQIESGAEVIQLFDSWAGVLTPEEFTRWSVLPTQKIVSALHKKYPGVPIIGFARQSGKMILEYISKTGIDAVSVDESHPILWVKDALQPTIVVQGGISNIVLAEDAEDAVAQTKSILKMWSHKPFVFNLTHGIVPHTPIATVEAVARTIKEFTRD